MSGVQSVTTKRQSFTQKLGQPRTQLSPSLPAPPWPAPRPPSRAEQPGLRLTCSGRVEEGLWEMHRAPSPHPQHPVVHPRNCAFSIPLEN